MVKQPRGVAAAPRRLLALLAAAAVLLPLSSAAALHRRGPHGGHKTRATPAPPSLACARSYSAKWAEAGGVWTVKAGSDEYSCGGCSADCNARYDYQKGFDGPLGFNGAVPEKCYASPPAQELFDCDHIEAGRTLNVVFHGSSHTRVNYFHVHRLLTRNYWPDPLPSDMTAEWAGGSKIESKPSNATDKSAAGSKLLDGQDKFSSSLLGWQQKELPICQSRATVKLLFMFKHMYDNHDDDVQLLQHLQEFNMSRPDYFITETSIWSMYYKPGGLARTNSYYLEEEANFSTFVRKHFGRPETQTIWLVGSGESPNEPLVEAGRTPAFEARIEQWRAANPEWRVCPMSRELLARPPGGMVCAHGCDGPVPMILAQMLIQEWNLFLTGASTFDT